MTPEEKLREKDLLMIDPLNGDDNSETVAMMLEKVLKKNLVKVRRLGSYILLDTDDSEGAFAILVLKLDD